MLRQALSRLGGVTHVAQPLQRHFGVSAVVCEKAATVTDPIQQMFLDKVREYRSKSAGGKLVDATPKIEAALKEELSKLDNVYSAAGQDMTKFPSFSFVEPVLQSVGLGETREIEDVQQVQEVEEVEEDNKPYFDY